MKKFPNIARTKLLDGFIGYKYFNYSDLARMYDEAFPGTTKGRVRVIDASNPKVTIAEYSRPYIEKTSPNKSKFKVIKGAK